MLLIEGIPLFSRGGSHFEKNFKERFFFMKTALESFLEPLQFCVFENIQS